MSINPPSLEEQIWALLQEIYDPEIPVNIVDLGLVYGVAVEDTPNGKSAKITMTLTNPACVMGPMLSEMIKSKVNTLPQISDASVEIVWEPVWSKDMISERGRMELGLM